MVDTSPIYRELRRDINATYEVRVIMNGTTYGMDKIRSISIQNSLFSGNGPELGGTVSGRCDLVLMETSANWPRMAEFEIQIRLVNGNVFSEWISMGTFYTDERDDGYNGILSITAFDGMLLLEQSWTDKIREESMPTSWPITAYEASQLLVEATGVQLDSRVVLDDTVPFVGLNTARTAREVWGDIAAAMGGNCVITREKKIRILDLNTSLPGNAAVAGIAVAGVAIVGTDLPQEYKDKNIDIHDLDLSIRSFEHCEPLPEITGVELSTETGSTVFRGNRTGYVIGALCNYSDSNITEVCLAKVEGFQYRPFTATGTSLDPAAEVGDVVIINGNRYPLITANWKLNKSITCDISAPYDAEVDHEYTKQPEPGKTLRKALQEQEKLEERIYSSIQQNANHIMTQVGNTYVTFGDVNDLSAEYDAKLVTLQTTITQTAENLELEIQGVNEEYDELRMHYRFDIDGETIGKSNSPKKLKLSNDGIDMIVNEESITHWNQDEMYAPRKVNIPLGGSLQLGNFIFQPRSSGNMSVLWIGD